MFDGEEPLSYPYFSHEAWSTSGQSKMPESQPVISDLLIEVSQQASYLEKHEKKGVLSQVVNDDNASENSQNKRGVFKGNY